MTRNINLILGEVANRCFTEEQKQILEYQQGTTTITIADQLKRQYSGMYLVHSVDDTFNYIAQIVYENSYLIDEIKDLQERIKLIKDPRSYKETSTSNSDNLSCSNAAANSEQLNRNIAISDFQNENASTSYARGINSEPDKLVKQLDILKDNTKLDSLPIQREKINFVNTEIKADKLLDINKELIATQQANPVSDELKYHNSSFSKTGDYNLSRSNNFSDGRSISKGNTNSKGVSVGKSQSKQEKEVLADSLLKSLTVKIPQKRIEFWMRFWPLFTKCNVCWE